MLIDKYIDYAYWNDDEHSFCFYEVKMKEDLAPFKKGDEFHFKLLLFAVPVVT